MGKAGGGGRASRCRDSGTACFGRRWLAIPPLILSALQRLQLAASHAAACVPTDTPSSPPPICWDLDRVAPPDWLSIHCRGAWAVHPLVLLDAGPHRHRLPQQLRPEPQAGEAVHREPHLPGAPHSTRTCRAAVLHGGGLKTIREGVGGTGYGHRSGIIGEPWSHWVWVTRMTSCSPLCGARRGVFCNLNVDFEFLPPRIFGEGVI